MLRVHLEAKNCTYNFLIRMQRTKIIVKVKIKLKIHEVERSKHSKNKEIKQNYGRYMTVYMLHFTSNKIDYIFGTLNNSDRKE